MIKPGRAERFDYMSHHWEFSAERLYTTGERAEVVLVSKSSESRR